MKTLTVRSIPESVYQTLKECAKRNHRSLQEQVRMILERETRLVRGATTPARARQWRERLRDRPLGDIVRELREDRRR